MAFQIDTFQNDAFQIEGGTPSVNVSDNISVSESVTVKTPTYYINASDNINVLESCQTHNILQIMGDLG